MTDTIPAEISVSGVDKNQNGGIIKSAVDSGKIKLEINHEKQARHIKGSKEFIEGKSYLTISEGEAQKIILERAGTGELAFNKFGVPQKEKIECGKIIGIDVDLISKYETPTNKGTIHYSNTGTHLVPRKETNGDDK